MGIRIQPTGLATLYSKAATLTGQAQRAQREIEMNRRAAEQMQSLQNQREMAEFNQQLTIEGEKRRAVRQYESEERSHQWEMEKAEMRSRADFAEIERARQEKRANLRRTLDIIDEIETIPDSTKEGLKTKAMLDFQQVSVSDRVLFPDLYGAEEDKAPSRTDVGAALEFLAEVEEKEKSWGIPYWSDPKPTAEEREAVPYYQDILRRAGMDAGEAAQAAAGMTPVEQDVNINVRPSSKDEFKSIVRQLNSFDKNKAQIYYDRYLGAFEW